MGQIDLAIFCMLLNSFISGTSAFCSVQSSRSVLESEFMKRWSHLQCKIQHDGRVHNRTRHHNLSDGSKLSHTDKEKDCIIQFENTYARRFFNPVMECIYDSTDSNISKNLRRTNSRLRRIDRSCFENKIRGSGFTPELKKLGNDIIASLGKCCPSKEAPKTDQNQPKPTNSWVVADLKSRQMSTRRKERVDRSCIRNQFKELLESFNANNDPLEHLNMLVKAIN